MVNTNIERHDLFSHEVYRDGRWVEIYPPSEITDYHISAWLSEREPDNRTILAFLLGR